MPPGGSTRAEGAVHGKMPMRGRVPGTVAFEWRSDRHSITRVLTVDPSRTDCGRTELSAFRPSARAPAHGLAPHSAHKTPYQPTMQATVLQRPSSGRLTTITHYSSLLFALYRSHASGECAAGPHGLCKSPGHRCAPPNPAAEQLLPPPPVSLAPPTARQRLPRFCLQAPWRWWCPSTPGTRSSRCGRQQLLPGWSAAEVSLASPRPCPPARAAAYPPSLRLPCS